GAVSGALRAQGHALGAPRHLRLERQRPPRPPRRRRGPGPARRLRDAEAPLRLALPRIDPRVLERASLWERLQPALLPRQTVGLDAVADAKLADGLRQIVAHGALREAERGGSLAGGLAF